MPPPHVRRPQNSCPASRQPPKATSSDASPRCCRYPRGPGKWEERGHPFLTGSENIREKQETDPPHQDDPPSSREGKARVAGTRRSSGNKVTRRLSSEGDHSVPPLHCCSHPWHLPRRLQIQPLPLPIPRVVVDPRGHAGGSRTAAIIVLCGEEVQGGLERPKGARIPQEFPSTPPFLWGFSPSRVLTSALRLSTSAFSSGLWYTYLGGWGGGLTTGYQSPSFEPHQQEELIHRS